VPGMRTFLIITSLVAWVAVGCSDDETTATVAGAGGGTTTSAGTGGDATGGNGGNATSNGGSGGNATGGEGGGMGATQACQECFATVFVAGSSCVDAVEACDADTDCDAWKNCSEACFNDDDTVACYDACDANHPHDTSLSDPLWTCLCDTCSAQCVAACDAH
jgi:hypothetical protein